MNAAEQTQRWTGWHTLGFFVAAGPLIANSAEIVINKAYGWKLDFVPDSWVFLPVVVGASLTLVWRIVHDWRSGKLRLAVHGPLSIMTVTFIASGALHAITKLSGVDTPIEASMFVLGVIAACFVMLLMAPDERG